MPLSRNILHLHLHSAQSFALILTLALANPSCANDVAHSSAAAAQAVVLPNHVQAVLTSRCMDCHSADTSEGNVRFDNLPTLQRDAQLDLLNLAQEQIFFDRMPPKETEQLSKAERQVVVDWLATELQNAGASRLQDKLRGPEYGNYVNHDQLFSGQHRDLKAFTYDRRWLISEYIFDAKFNRLLNHRAPMDIDGKRYEVIGSNNRSVNLTNPFLLPTNSGVRYYANETLNGGHLLTMLTNAKEASVHMLYLAGRDTRYLPAINDMLALEDLHKATLARRESFLNKFIDRVLIDSDAEQHTGLLPVFNKAALIPPAIVPDELQKKVRIGAASPGRLEEEIIYRTIRRHQAEGDTDEQLIEKSVHEWVNFGHSERKIQVRITFMRGYLPELRENLLKPNIADRYKPYEYAPLAEEEMASVVKTLRSHRHKGDHYNTIIARCMTQWQAEFQQARIDAGPPTDEVVSNLVEQLFVKILERPPTAGEAAKHLSLTHTYIKNLGRQKTIAKLIQTLILNTEFVYRSEFGQNETEGTRPDDEFGRRMMSPRDASYAIAYALTDSSPDQTLATAAAEGRLNTREDHAREVRRLLKNRDQYYLIDEDVVAANYNDNVTNMPIRELRFFREFFGYPKMLSIFKDNKRFGGNYENSKGRLVGEADQLVAYLLESDQDVFHQLLTTDSYFVYHTGNNEAMAVAAENLRQIHEYFQDKNWREFTLDELEQHREFLTEHKVHRIGRDNLAPFRDIMSSIERRFDKGQVVAPPYYLHKYFGPKVQSRTKRPFDGEEVAKSYNIDLANWDYPTVQPAKVANRKGLLTHPAWLIAFAQNTETDPIHRGKWIQEKLLAGTIPDVPITVDAVVPEDPHKTLRQRMVSKTGNEYCRTCHQKMEPLGLPFEMFDDFGRYRTEERLEYPENLITKVDDKGKPYEDLRDIYKAAPIDARGSLEGTGDSRLDGDVNNALELIDRLAQSDHVRQSIIRHAFRYFLGRNERLSDSRTLIDADTAYLDSGGSFDAVIVSLLTSDSFLYRKATKD